MPDAATLADTEATTGDDPVVEDPPGDPAATDPATLDPPPSGDGEPATLDPDPVVEDPPPDIDPPPDPTVVDVEDDGPAAPTDPNRAPWSNLDPEQIAALDVLRAPVRPSEVGYKPTVWCRACTDAKPRKACEQHAVITCDKCQQRITEAHFDLTFMGHAAVTRRLLDADPTWDWAPLGTTDAGTPIASDGGMWIRLTVAGMSRIGFGDAGGKSGGNAVKEIIGDAIRNAAMRFGVGLELWHKGDWTADDAPATDHAASHNGPQRDATPPNAGSPAPAGPGPSAGSTAPATAGSADAPFDLDVVVNTLMGVRSKKGWDALRIAADNDGLLPAQIDWRGETMPLTAAFDRRAAEIQAGRS